MKIKTTSLLLSLVLVTIGVTPVVGNSRSLPPVEGPPPPVEVNGDELAVGDIVATGIRGEGGDCNIDAVKVRTTAPGQGKTQWLGIVLDTHCRVVVNAKWEGPLTDGPVDVIEPLLRILPVSPTIPEKPQLDLMSRGGASGLSALACSLKTSEQLVFMYGYGGTWDKLTRKTGKLTFCYDGVNATINSQSGTCQGSTPGSWSWVVDACVTIDVRSGPAPIVWRTGRGDYHCNPPSQFPCNIPAQDGYYHSLYDSEDGHSNGTSHCSFWWTGVIVAGVDRQILQGCT